MNKSLPAAKAGFFTAMIRSAGNAGSCGCLPSADSKPIYNINVAWLNFNNSNHGYNRFKEITYNYDLISGKVNEVDYQPGAVDQFYHRYEYDAENRITDVYTSDRKAYIGHKNLEEHEAFYEYYKHGPLARSVIGQQQVQGVDYAYTLQGWLKGVNSTSLNPAYDMGGDGNLVAQDAYSFGLNYFQNDYSPINSTVSPFPGFSGLFPSGYSYNPLYNGNISAMSVNIGKLNNPLLYNYQYDQLNRLVAMDAFTGLDTSNNKWNALSTDNSYRERVSYDANGNIQTYLRNGTTAGGTPLAMDNLTYNYTKDVNGQLQNNKLTSVNDAVAAGNYPDDIDNQSANNYGYDAIGNMTSDVAGGISNITWTVYGKIATITKTDGSTVAYTYDAAGNRISKTVTPASGAATTTWYVRDASGNAMAVYNATGSDSLHQTEQDLYGSSRLGIFNRNINADALLPTGTSASLIGNYFTSNFTRGNKLFEGDNQLGNVLITFTDKKFGVDTNGDGIIDFYNADVVNANDYYPFGMLMPARTFSGVPGSYRYGFNGKENDSDIENSAQDYGMRIYDGRLGRFLSVDMLAGKYPFLTPYQYSGNSPIAATDVDGNEFDWFTWKITYWLVKAKIGGTNAAENFKENIHTIAMGDNMGQFTSNDPAAVSQQVEEKKLNTLVAKAKVYGTTAKGATAATIGFGTPFLIGAAAPVLPELFTVAGTSELTFSGYLVQKTLLAAADAGAQKIVTGKIDLIDVFSDYLPAKGMFQKFLLTAFQASVDYSVEDGLTYLGGEGLNKKKISDVAIDAFASGSVEKVFGNFNKQLEKAFVKKGLKGEKLTQAIGGVVKSEADFLQNAIKTALAEQAKKMVSDDKKSNKP